MSSPGYTPGSIELDNGNILDPSTGILYDADGNVILDPSLSIASPNPTIGNNNNPSNVPTIAGTLAQYGAVITGILAGRAVQSSQNQVKVSAPGNQLQAGTQVSAGMILLLVLGGVALWALLK